MDSVQVDAPARPECCDATLIGACLIQESLRLNQRVAAQGDLKLLVKPSPSDYEVELSVPLSQFTVISRLSVTARTEHEDRIYIEYESSYRAVFSFKRFYGGSGDWNETPLTAFAPQVLQTFWLATRRAEDSFAAAGVRVLMPTVELEPTTRMLAFERKLSAGAR